MYLYRWYMVCLFKAIFSGGVACSGAWRSREVVGVDTTDAVERDSASECGVPEDTVEKAEQRARRVGPTEVPAMRCPHPTASLTIERSTRCLRGKKHTTRTSPDAHDALAQSGGRGSCPSSPARCRSVQKRKVSSAPADNTVDPSGDVQRQHGVRMPFEVLHPRHRRYFQTTIGSPRSRGRSAAPSPRVPGQRADLRPVSTC